MTEDFKNKVILFDTEQGKCWDLTGLVAEFRDFFPDPKPDLITCLKLSFGDIATNCFLIQNETGERYETEFDQIAFNIRKLSVLTEAENKEQMYTLIKEAIM